MSFPQHKKKFQFSLISHFIVVVVVIVVVTKKPKAYISVYLNLFACKIRELYCCYIWLWAAYSKKKYRKYQLNSQLFKRENNKNKIKGKSFGPFAKEEFPQPCKSD